MNQLNKKPHSHGLFFGLLGLLLGLCMIRYGLQVNIPPVMMLAVAVLISLLGDRDEIAAMCICCIPLHTSLEYTYVLLLSLLIWLVKFSRTIRFNLTIVPVLLLLLWELLHCFGEPFSPVIYVGCNMPLLLLAVLMCSEGRFDYDFIVRALTVSIAAMCLSLLGRLLYVTGFDFGAALSGLRRLGYEEEEGWAALTVTGGQLNPNTLGILCVLGITGLLQVRSSGRERRGDMLLVLLLLLFGTMTSSRTYVALLAIMAVLLLFSQKGSTVQKLKFLGGALLVLLAALLLLALFFPDLLAFYYSRFFEADASGGRMDLMAVYHRFIMSEPRILLFGTGLQSFEQKLMGVYRVSSQVPHNGLQELVIIWGIPGLLLFGLLWLAMLLRSRQAVKSQSLLHLIPLLVLLAKIQVGQMLNSQYTMLAFSYAYLSLCGDIRPGRSRIKTGKT